MCIRNILHGLRACLKTCVLVGTMIFVSGIMTAEASICFLPTGRCSQSVSTKVQNCKNWTSPERDEYCSKQSGYVKDEDVPTAIASGFSCVSAVKAKGDVCCEGWSLCIQENCLDQGFKLTEKKDENYYICASCSQGGKTFYKCKAKPCNYDTDTTLSLNEECTNTNGLYCLKSHEKCINGYEWVADATKKAGSQACGKCQAKNPPTPVHPEECLAGVYYWVEQIPHGCVACSAVGNITGKIYYCCNYLDEYNIPEGDRESSETSCKTYEGPVEASGYEVLVQHEKLNCYKEIEKTCGNKNQYLDQSLDGCYCRDYSYYLDATPTYLGYTAAGGKKNVSVTSTISTRTRTENYPYAVDTDHVQSCSISSSGNKVKVSCEPNPRTEPITASFNITQTPKVVTTTHKVLYKTISLKIDGDTCTPYQFSNKCSDACDVAEYRNQSVSGASPCYECVNDCCPTGYTKGSTPSPTEGYDTTTTAHKSNCYKAKTCKDGSTTTNRNAAGECYDCSAHGYAGPTQCWLCSHMNTTCDTANGYRWDEGSCKCIPAGCTEGDVSKQSVSDCGTSGDKGWIYESKGKSGGKNCGVCTKKNCSGDTSNKASNGNYFECTSCFYGDVEKFTCTCPLTDAICGDGKSADLTTCTCKNCPETCASHGWVTSTSECAYGYDSKGTLCRADCYACRACTDTCAKHSWTSLSGDCRYGYDVKQDDCGATCYACKACTDTCSAHGWKSSANDCSYGSNPKQDDCGAACFECKACTPVTCSTSTYPYTSRDLTSTSNTNLCDPGCDGTKRYKCASGYKIKNNKCVSDVCPSGTYKSGDSHLNSCANGTEYAGSTSYGTSCYQCKSCVSNDGYFGDTCCSSDSDCKSSSEFPLYCFNGVCHECASLSDCAVGTRFYSKYGSGASGCRLANHNGPNGSYQLDTYETSVSSLTSSYAERVACRSGECTTY